MKKDGEGKRERRFVRFYALCLSCESFIIHTSHKVRATGCQAKGRFTFLTCLWFEQWDKAVKQYMAKWRPRTDFLPSSDSSPSVKGYLDKY